jgi:hypothetical protein
VRVKRTFECSKKKKKKKKNSKLAGKPETHLNHPTPRHTTTHIIIIIIIIIKHIIEKQMNLVKKMRCKRHARGADLSRGAPYRRR